MIEANISDTTPEFYCHPLLKENCIQWREYQVNISRAAIERNTLIVLPTALGKTMIALFNAVELLAKAPQAKVFILAPTRPLVMQHYQTFIKLLKPEIRCCVFSSQLPPIQRAFALNDHQIFFSTPQILQNDVQKGLYSLEGVGLIIFDEAHKARHNYAYTYDAQTYIQQCHHPLIMGLTASPGKDLERINLLCEKLFIEQIVFRDRESPDVENYVFPIDAIFTRVDLPTEIVEAQALLESALRKIHDFMIDQGIFPKKNYYSKMDYIRLIHDMKILEDVIDPYYEKREESASTLTYPQLIELFDPKKQTDNSKTHLDSSVIVTKAIEGIYLSHLVEILTVQDVRMFQNYLRKLQDRSATGNKTVQRMLNSKVIENVSRIIAQMKKSPKIPTLITILQNEFIQNPKAKIIVFSQFREMATYILNEINNQVLTNKITIHAQRFVGQASKVDDPGLRQSEQQEIIHAFESGDFNVLIATSIAEEGLDIPNVDAVVFYEAIPSEIRLIQRRGRTGRHEIGRCYFLVSPNTLDQVYHIVSQKKEENMKSLLKQPDMVQTIPELARSSALPSHQTKSLVEIKDQYEHAKQAQVEQRLKAAKEEIAKNATKRTNSSFQYVTDITETLTANSQSRTQRQAENQVDLLEHKNKLKIMVKKIYNWILNTMDQQAEYITYQDHQYLTCDLKVLHQAAQTDGMDARKIDVEIAKGIRNGLFVKMNSKIISTDN